MQSSKFKTCIINGQEQYAFAQIVGGSPMMTELAAQMFPEALLSFVDLDMGNVSELILAMNTCVISVADIADKGYQGEFLRILEALAQQHIYFELFRLEWIDRIQQARSANILKRHWRNEKVRYLPKVLEDIQRQIKDMFKYVLDYDSGNGTALEKAASYYKKTDEPIFSFRPLLMHFEFWHNDTFAEVVYPESIYDLISYHLQECIRRGLRLRVCRNCGRYFHMSGRNTAVYCCRPYGEKGHICRKNAAARAWEEKNQKDTIFHEYRREYKRRFAWINAGKIERDDFYAWSKQAREKKAECSAGSISYETFTEWLRTS